MLGYQFGATDISKKKEKNELNKNKVHLTPIHLFVFIHGRNFSSQSDIIKRLFI